MHSTAALKTGASSFFSGTQPPAPSLANLHAELPIRDDVDTQFSRAFLTAGTRIRTPITTTEDANSTPITQTVYVARSVNQVEKLYDAGEALFYRVHAVTDWRAHHFPSTTGKASVVVAYSLWGANENLEWAALDAYTREHKVEVEDPLQAIQADRVKSPRLDAAWAHPTNTAEQEHFIVSDDPAHTTEAIAGIDYTFPTDGVRGYGVTDSDPYQLEFAGFYATTDIILGTAAPPPPANLASSMYQRMGVRFSAKGRVVVPNVWLAKRGEYLGFAYARLTVNSDSAWPYSQQIVRRMGDTHRRSYPKLYTTEEGDIIPVVYTQILPVVQESTKGRVGWRYRAFDDIARRGRQIPDVEFVRVIPVGMCEFDGRVSTGTMPRVDLAHEAIISSVAWADLRGRINTSQSSAPHVVQITSRQSATDMIASF